MLASLLMCVLLPLSTLWTKGNIQALIIHTAAEKGLTEQQTKLALAIANCESGYNGTLVHSAGNHPAGSIDAGLWQINDFYNPGITEDEAFSPVWSTNYALDQIKSGHQAEWACNSIINKK